MRSFSNLLVGMLLLLASGCARPPDHPYKMATEPGHGLTMTRAFVAPMNASQPTPDELQPASAATFDELRGYLESKGISVQTMGFLAFREKLNAASVVRPVSAGDGSEAPPTTLAGNLLSRIEGEYDMLIVPSLVIREVRLKHNNGLVRWDGVRRFMQLPNSGPYVARYDLPVPAASLFVRIYDGEGIQLYEGFGGLNVVWELNIVERNRSAQFEVQDDLVDREHLREGVCVAFHPFFGEEETCG